MEREVRRIAALCDAVAGARPARGPYATLIAIRNECAWALEGRVEQVTVGRIVHWVSFEAGVHRAALVTALGDGGRVSLCVFGHASLDWPTSVGYEAGGVTPGTWHWPERA